MAGLILRFTIAWILPSISSAISPILELILQTGKPLSTSYSSVRPDSCPARKFLIAGAMYSSREAWPPNVRHFEHVAPPQHCSFYSSSPLTLNVTRGSMAAMGYCPSGRLFEAAACGTAVLSDWWTGLDSFFEPGAEILIASVDLASHFSDREGASVTRRNRLPREATDPRLPHC